MGVYYVMGGRTSSWSECLKRVFLCFNTGEQTKRSESLKRVLSVSGFKTLKRFQSNWRIYIEQLRLCSAENKKGSVKRSLTFTTG
jgi:hypothetical protein